jgi:hypothetical protein
LIGICRHRILLSGDRDEVPFFQLANGDAMMRAKTAVACLNWQTHAVSLSSIGRSRTPHILQFKIDIGNAPGMAATMTVNALAPVATRVDRSGKSPACHRGHDRHRKPTRKRSRAFAREPYFMLTNVAQTAARPAPVKT